jgi:hypothetical protein
LYEVLHGVREGVVIQHLEVLGGIPATLAHTLSSALTIGRLSLNHEYTEQEECGDS